MKHKRARLLFLLKLWTSLVLLAFLFSRLDLFSLYNIVASADLYYFVIATGAFFIVKMACAVRWALLARALGFRNSLGQFFAYYLFGMFFNLFMPSTLGGDAARVFYLLRDGPKILAGEWKTSMGRALLSVAADRVIGVVVLLWIGAVALAIFPDYGATVPWMLRYTIWSGAVGAVGFGLLPWAAGSRLERWHGLAWIGSLLQSLTPYRTNPRLIAKTIFLSFIVHLIQPWIQLLIGDSIGINIPWSYCFIFFPVVDILSTLPLSVSGLGLREGGYFYFLGKLGIGPEQAVACSMLWFAVVLFNGLFGGVVFLAYRRSTAAYYAEDIRQIST